MGGIALIVIGSIIFCASLGYGIFRLVKSCRTHLNGETDEKQRKDLIVLLSLVFASGVGLMLMLMGIGYSHKAPYSAGNLAMIIIGTVLFGFAFNGFIFSLTLKHFKHDLTEKHWKINKWFNIGALLASIVGFIVMMEGFAPYLDYPLYNTIVFGGPGGISLSKDDKGGGFSIALYALCILGGAVLVYFISDHRVYKETGKHNQLESTFLLAFPAGLVGARLWYCYVLEFDLFSKWDGKWDCIIDGYNANPFKVWDGGLAIMGGAILGIIVGVLWVLFRKKELKLRRVVDIVVPAILIAQAIGRWGNFFNREVYASSNYILTWWQGWWIPSFVKNNMMTIDTTLAAQGMYRVPLFYVEFITNLGGYFILRWLCEELLINRKKWLGKGSCAGFYLIWYGCTRIGLEPLREGQYEYDSSFYSAIGMVVAGVIVIGLLTLYEKVLEQKIREKHPNWFIENRQPKLVAESVNSEASINAENDVQNVKIPAEPKQKSKKGSINDDL